MQLWSSPEWLRFNQGRLLWWPDAFSGEADHWLAQLSRDIPWQQHRLTMFGRDVSEPRLSCWMGEWAYRYSGRERAPVPWHPLVKAMAERLELICGQPFDGVLLNLYRNGNDSMGWHADDEPELGRNPTIASVSLGATRRFLLRHHSGEQQELWLEHGSLLVMAGEMQHHWRHALPKMVRTQDVRINLTFRRSARQA
ncbi:alpha-ketoglutarate-dependent dioxygenase AlkB [Oceanimonas baumannii]|uniref:alpha-ketoglutarate-dependent dioxygenase AlkB family protein n=1 Tax=Oceanimonas baumannii TaxID=129578 RepID=UPI001D195430|nr:alpha-ketoglutarate-dependent dioxygenase AlkB [Oceanimonas baumannii]MCC4265024.1 alpha-ketoglutarate-dependent dioxygenase AlkB [Oceanimonas baumannii]